MSSRFLFPLTVGLMAASTAFAGTPSTDPAALVPGGKPTQVEPHETHVTTPKGTLVEIEFYADGSLDEASGDAASAGDLFVPGSGFLSLADVIKKVSTATLTISGDWEFEHHLAQGWIYELDGVENGAKYDLHVSAVDGKVLSKTLDD